MNIDGRGKEVKAVRSWKSDHKDPTWKSYTAAQYYDPFKKRPEAPTCEVDEWPPNYFLDQQQTELETTDPNGQLVRWIPQSHNGQAAKQWQGFCKEHDGDVGNGQRTPLPANKQIKEDDEV